MSSVGQALGGVVGGVIGFFVGGPSGAYYGAQIGIMAGGVIDPPKGPTINGPRLDDLSVQTSTYGAFLPRAYGTVPIVGNVFWVQGDKLIEVITSTTSGGKGGPETTTNTAAYYATFAVGLCEGPIDGVRRIWIGGQLWYDAGSDDLSTIIASNEKADLFTLYHGTDTQNPDPLIQADRGAANVPAYRGRAYIVFDHLPLDKYNNSLMGAQVKVEVVNSGTFSDSMIDSDTIAYSGAWHTTNASAGNQHDSTGAANYVTKSATFGGPVYWLQKIGDVLTVQTLESTSTVFDPITSSLNEIQYVYQADSRYPRWGSGGNVFYYDCGSGNAAAILADGGGNCFMVREGTSGNALVQVPLDVAHGVTLGVARQVYPYSEIALSGIDYALSVWNGNAVIFWASSSATLSVEVYSGDITTPLYLSSSFTVALGTTYGIKSNDSVGYVDGDILTIVTTVTTTTAVILVIDLANQVLLGTHSVSASLAGLTISLYANLSVDGDLVYWGQRITTGGGNIFHSNTWSLNKITGSSVSLGDIVSAECLASSLLEAADIDVTGLTDSVRGYRVSQMGAIRGGIDPLRAAWPFDVVQHGYQIKFKRRGSASVATIPASLLDARAAGEAPGVQITDAREMDLMLPRRVDVSYLDATREYDINKQMSPERTSTDAVGIRGVDMPIVFNAAEAQQKAETLLYLYWIERYDVSLRLPPEYSELEPGDVITVMSDTADYELRLVSTNTLPDGRIEVRAKYNKAAIYTPVARGEEGQSTGALLTLDGPAVYSLLDIPLMRDDDDTAGFPVAMAGYLSGWPGGVLYRSDDGGQTWADLRAFTPGAVIGYATGTLSAHGGTIIDFSSTLAVRLYSGTLASVTQAQMFAGQNWFAYGAHGRWEIIAAANAVLQGDGSYVLSDFLRGQRGTEWSTGLHAANDRIILLDATALAFISVNSSTIGASRDYRAITTGKALSSDASQSFAYAGINLECLSPVHLTGNRHPSTNDWTLVWTRRSRYAQWRDYVDAPLGEASESYEVDVYADGSYATLKRTITATSQTASYTSAQQVTDFGSNQATLYLKIYQLSATVGRGYPLTQSITR